MTSVLRIPPHNEEIEKALLGTMLIKKENIQLIKSLLQPEDFYKEIHKELCTVIIQLDEDEKPVDILTLLDAMKDSRDIITPVFLAELMDATPATSAANVIHHAKILKDYKHRRDTIKATTALLNKAYEGDYFQEIQEIENVITRVPGNSKGQAHRAGELLDTTLTIIENNQNNGGCVGAIPTGFTDLDNKLSGVTKGELTIVAARPSMGKTAFMLNVAESMTIKNNTTAAIFSMEMSKELVMQRLISQLTHIDSMKLKTGQLEEADWTNIAKITNVINNAGLYIDDTTPQTVTQIKNKCKEIKGLDVIFIDYLDFIAHESKTENRVQQISEITKALKTMAKQLNIAVVLLVQLNRSCEQRTNKRPVLSDLRDSGAIEQDADVVIFLYRDEYYNPDTDKKNIGEIITAKNRNGQTGTVELVWVGQLTKYINKNKY